MGTFVRGDYCSKIHATFQQMSMKMLGNRCFDIDVLVDIDVLQLSKIVQKQMHSLLPTFNTGDAGRFMAAIAILSSNYPDPG